jgi:hypothetical protein
MSRPRSHHKRGPKPKAPHAPRVTPLRSIGYTEAQVGRTERKLNRPKLSKADLRRNQLLLVLAESGDLDLFKRL